MRFSQRMGLTEVRDAIQGRSLDKATRTRLWSAFSEMIPNHELSGHGTWMEEFYKELWSNFFVLPVDETPGRDYEVRGKLKEIFLSGPWYEVFDLLEFSIQSNKFGGGNRLVERVASILEEEMAGFRLLDDQFIEITDESEIAAISDALEITGDRFSPARTHLSTALQLLSDRKEPDYRNSAKESISAVEAVIQILSGDPKADLSKGLRVLEGNAPLHGAFVAALKALYGYSSDADGIRHSLIEEANIDAPTAKFMLVVCSAFVVYLIQKAA